MENITGTGTKFAGTDLDASELLKFAGTNGLRCKVSSLHSFLRSKQTDRLFTRVSVTRTAMGLSPMNIPFIQSVIRPRTACTTFTARGPGL